MKKELLEIAKENKLKTAAGLILASLALTTCDIQKNEYHTLKELRAKDNSPENRYRLDYGGNVKWLKDPQTGTSWDAMGKDQCLADSVYSVDKSLQYIDQNNILHIETPKKRPDLKFSGIENTNKRLIPADSYTRDYLFTQECQITDY